MGWFSKKKTQLKKEKEDLINEIKSLGQKVEDLSKNAMMHSESILGKRRRGEDGGEASKRLKGSAEAKPSFEKYFEILHGNLNDLETTTDQIEEENYNLSNNVKAKDAEIAKLMKQHQQHYKEIQEIKSDLKQKERECIYFRETYVKALEQLRQHQTGDFNFIERDPQTYPVAFSEGINNLVDELNKIKKENLDLLQYKKERENEVISLQVQITSLQQINSKLQNKNQQLQAIVDEARTLSMPNEFEKAANANQEQCDTLEEALRLLSRISEYEEQLKTRDISTINTKLQELNKSLRTLYGKEICKLNLEILKLLRSLNDEQLNKQHEVFNRAMNLKTEALEREQENCYLLNSNDLRKKFKNRLGENVCAVEDELKTFQRIILDFPSIEDQRRMAYKDIVSALTYEYTRLQNLSLNKHHLPKIETVSFDLPADDIVLENSYVRETLQRLININKSIRELEEQVNKFRGSKTDKIFLDLEHKLLNNIMSVDTIQVNGYEVIRGKRREAIKYAQECMDKLNDNVINM